MEEPYLHTYVHNDPWHTMKHLFAAFYSHLFWYVDATWLFVALTAVRLLCQCAIMQIPQC